jgi:hypothetical protein
MNPEELMTVIISTLNFNNTTLEERSTEIINISADIKNYMYEIQHKNLTEFYENAIKQMKTPGELMYLFKSIGFRMGHIVATDNPFTTLR